MSGEGNKMKYFSAFTGAGGFELGLPSDWQCVGMSEVDKNANKILAYRFPGVKNYGDIEKINYEELPDFDVLVGGSPCQDVSIAGKRVGIHGTRSRLFFSYVTILKIKKPNYFIFENVKGLLSSNQGWDFAEVINQFSEAGYDIWWQILDASWFGIPQHRERVFVLGSLRRDGIRKVFFEPDNDKENTKIQRQRANTLTERYRKAQATGSYIIEGQFNAHKRQIDLQTPSASQPYRIYGTEGLAPTLHRRTGGQQVVKIFTNNNRVRYLTPLECERLMGWPDDWTRYGMNPDGKIVELSDNVRYSIIGNGVVPQVVSNLINMVMDVATPEKPVGEAEK
ncbi:MAG: DNA (cytosine-5-)-methyltransferase [Thermoplasmatales archaeon]